MKKKNNKKKWLVDHEHQGVRLDLFLVEQLGDITRSRIHQWIKKEHVLVNGKSVAKHHFLKEGDAIELDAEVFVDTPHKKNVWKNFFLPFLCVLYEDADIVVIEKPLGLLVHPSTEDEAAPTLAATLLRYAPSVGEVGEHVLRPGIVHRLDRDVSGVLVAAKTPQAWERLKRQFQERTVEKEYRALVHGIPSQQAGDIRLKISRSRTHGGRMAARPEHEEGRDAWTSYETLQTFQDRYALLSVRIHTGRTHQIRVHFSAIGHPIVGDTLYQSKQYSSQRVYSRLYLHAHRLLFDHPQTGERMEFISPLPVAFEEFFQ